MNQKIGIKPRKQAKTAWFPEKPVLYLHTGLKSDRLLGWRRLLERYRTQLNPLICLREALVQPAMQQLTQTWPS